MKTPTYEDILASTAADDDRIVIMTAENRAAIRSLPSKLGRRFIDVGIAEQTMIGAAAGLALRGRIPVVHALATFLTMRAFEFIRDDIGIPALPVKLIGAVPGVLSDGNGPTHQALEDIALMRGIPSMRIFCPSDAEELAGALPAILHDPHPWYVRYYAGPPAVVHTDPFVIGNAEVLTRGSDISIITYGFMLREAAIAMEMIARRGYSVRLINLRTLKPIDESAVLDAVRGTELVVTLEDHFQTGGLASIIAEILLRKRIMTNVLPITFGERWFHPALLNDVLRNERMDAGSLVETILDAM